jgi:DNA-binding winged helix-turn-helix (wHTH) protein
MTSPITFSTVASSTTIVVEGTPLTSLSPQETEILSLMLEHPGRIFSNRVLHSLLLSEADHKLIDVLMCKIRRKLDTAFGPSGSPIVIDTMWGLGYVLRPHDQPEINLTYRWTPNRKCHFLQLFKHLEKEGTDEQLALLRSNYPEITDHIIQEWDQYGVKAIF